MADLKKQWSTNLPMAVLNDKLKAKDDAHTLAVADLQAAVDVSEELRLEIVRLREEVKQQQEAEKQRLAEVETLRKNGEDLKVKLKEAVDAHDQTMQAAKEHELETEKLVGGLVAEMERVNQTILGMDPFPFFFSLRLLRHS